MPLSDSGLCDNPSLIRLSLIAPFVAFLENRAVSPKKPLKRLGLTYEMANNPDVFVHSEVFYGLMNELALEAKDPFLGLHVAEEMVLLDWPVLVNSLTNSRSVGEFLTHFVQNVPRHSTSVEHRLSVGPERTQYRVNRASHPVNKASQSDGFGAGLYLRIFGAVASTAWRPDMVTLLTSYPEAIPNSYHEATIEPHSDPSFAIEFPTDILFSEIVFDASKLNRQPSVTTKPTLVAAIRAVTKPLLAQGGDLNQAIAEALGIGTDLMEKTLAREGTTLSREIKTLKCDVACELLASTNSALAAIGESIGYSEPANFTRFFKSQLGMTPNQYRKTNMSENETV